VSARLNAGWDVFTDGSAKYADVLGPAGLVRCTQLLGQQQGNKSHGLSRAAGLPGPRAGRPDHGRVMKQATRRKASLA